MEWLMSKVRAFKRNLKKPADCEWEAEIDQLGSGEGRVEERD